MRYLRKVLASIRKADEMFSLIDAKDRIALGISGGKDSLCLLQAMHLYRKFSSKDFEIVPICLDLGFPGFDASKVQEWVKELGYELRVVDSREVYPILKTNAKGDHHLPCSICSRMKKAAINAAAKEFACNKVAFAHHKDDAVETLFMNMIHGGRVQTFEPMMHLDRADITFIRPLIFATESDLRGMAREEDLPVMERICPVDGATERAYIKERLSSLYKERPEAEANLASMLYHHEDFGLYFEHIEAHPMEVQGYGLTPLFSAKQALSYQKEASDLGLPLLPSSAEKVLLLKQDHKVFGAIAYDEAPHEIRIHSFDVFPEKEKEARIWLSLFLTIHGKNHNPCLFLYTGKNFTEIFQEEGFHEVEIEGQIAYAKRVFR